jgi:hypothetical protein
VKEYREIKEEIAIVYCREGQFVRELVITIGEAKMASKVKRVG